MDSVEIAAAVGAMRRAELADVAIDYADEGAGEPVVLLHGYPQSALTYRHQITTLSRTHRVIAPQWPGWGASSRDPGLVPEYNLELDRLTRFLDALGLRKINLVAHDYGGLLSLGFAIRHPERVIRYALLNSRAHRTFPVVSYCQFLLFGTLARSRVLRSIFRYLPLGAMHRRSLAKYVRIGCFDDALLEHYVGWMDTPGGRRWLGQFYRYYELRPRLELTAGIDRIRCPTSIIWGDADPYCPYRIAEQLRGFIPQAKLVRIAGADHYVMEERPADVTAALLDLLAHPEPGSPDIGEGPVAGTGMPAARGQDRT